MTHIIFFRPVTQYENLGDLVINQELLKSLPKDSSIVIDGKGIPKWFMDDLVKGVNIDEVINDKKSYYKNIFSALSGNGKVVFLDVPGHVFYESADRSGWLRYFKMKILSLMGVKYVRLGVSLGPYGESALKLEQKKGSVYHFTGVREEYSQAYLTANKIPQFQYFPDFGLCLEFKSNPKDKRELIGYSFRSGVTSSDPKSAEHTKKIVSDITTVKSSLKLQPIVQVNLDAEYMSVLANELNDSNEAVTFLEHNGELVMSAYQSCKYVISNRLHVLLFALSRGAFAIPYIDRAKHTKVTGVFEDIGLGNMIFDIAGDTKFPEHLEQATGLYESLDIKAIFRDKKSEINKLINEKVFL